MTAEVQETREGGIVTLTMSNPGKLNAMSQLMRDELTASFARLNADPAVRVIILTGADGNFSAGAPLAFELMKSAFARDLEQALQAEIDLQPYAWLSEDHEEGSGRSSRSASRSSQAASLWPIGGGDIERPCWANRAHFRHSAALGAACAGVGPPLHHGYGMTEYAGSMFVTRIERPRRDCSPGELNPDCEVQLVPTADTAPGVAEIWVRGPGTMLGYYRAPDLTREAVTADGWLRTADIGRLEAGALFIVGRSKDMIKRLGFAIYPSEIEAELSSHPAVRLAAVIGIAGRHASGEKIVAFVEAQPGQTVDPVELLAYVRDRLVSFKRPAEIIPVQSMPLTANGKIRKQELRSMLTGAG
jgi:acyl-CoA synthetase (AMP-forming)/AMP-acid ligase II